GGDLSSNNLSASGTVLEIDAAFAGSIAHNDIQEGKVGLAYNAAASISANFIHNNATGVVATVSDTQSGFGFVAASLPNAIYANSLGVQLAGVMQNQHIYGNATGVAGSGILGGPDFDHANLIEFNGTGVNFTGTIQFN